MLFRITIEGYGVNVVIITIGRGPPILLYKPLI